MGKPEGVRHERKLLGAVMVSPPYIVGDLRRKLAPQDVDGTRQHGSSCPNNIND